MRYERERERGIDEERGSSSGEKEKERNDGKWREWRKWARNGTYVLLKIVLPRERLATRDPVTGEGYIHAVISLSLETPPSIEKDRQEDGKLTFRSYMNSSVVPLEMLTSLECSATVLSGTAMYLPHSSFGTEESSQESGGGHGSTPADDRVGRERDGRVGDERDGGEGGNDEGEGGGWSGFVGVV